MRWPEDRPADGPVMSRWSDRSYLRDVQYRTDANLAARQSIYAYQQPPVDLVGQVLDLAFLAGGGAGVVADVGCGNGMYLAGLARRRPAGHLIGVDLSPGMLQAARRRAQEAAGAAPALLVGDASALPLRDESVDLVLAMHMLYHVPEPELAVRELRRVTRTGGRLVVGLNGGDHHRELRAVVTAALADLGHPAAPMASDGSAWTRARSCCAACSPPWPGTSSAAGSRSLVRNRSRLTCGAWRWPRSSATPKSWSGP